MERQPFAPIAQAEKGRFAPGETVQPEQFSPGDFILTHSNSFYGWLIRFGQRLRFRGEDQKFGWWNHAAVIVSTDGDLIEALNAGVRRTNEIAFEFPKPVYLKPTKITCRLCKAPSYSDLSKNNARQFFPKLLKPARLRHPTFQRIFGPG